MAKPSIYRCYLAINFHARKYCVWKEFFRSDQTGTKALYTLQHRWEFKFQVDLDKFNGCVIIIGRVVPSYTFSARLEFRHKQICFVGFITCKCFRMKSYFIRKHVSVITSFFADAIIWNVYKCVNISKTSQLKTVKLLEKRNTHRK